MSVPDSSETRFILCILMNFWYCLYGVKENRLSLRRLAKLSNLLCSSSVKPSPIITKFILAKFGPLSAILIAKQKLTKKIKTIIVNFIDINIQYLSFRG